MEYERFNEENQDKEFDAKCTEQIKDSCGKMVRFLGYVLETNTEQLMAGNAEMAQKMNVKNQGVPLSLIEETTFKKNTKERNESH